MISINKSIMDRPFSVAISGGVDSLAGAHFLKTLGYKFKAIHYNHNQRPQNNVMVDSCEKFCKDNDIELVVGVCNTRFYKNIESNLRNKRLAFFGEVGGDIILCHHLDDAVESSLMLWMRGKMDHVPIPEITKFDKFTIKRPFIKTDKSELVNWATKRELNGYLVVDETNDDINYERNWVRNEIIPKLKARRGMNKMILKRFYKGV